VFSFEQLQVGCLQFGGFFKEGFLKLKFWFFHVLDLQEFSRNQSLKEFKLFSFVPLLL
jgi:hypothetical protein